jgi:hypothetical protein
MEEGNKKNGFFMPAGMVRDDRILPEVRWLAVLIIPFLVVAFIHMGGTLFHYTVSRFCCLVA